MSHAGSDQFIDPRLNDGTTSAPQQVDFVHVHVDRAHLVAAGG
jgi:hypothetical protein